MSLAYRITLASFALTLSTTLLLGQPAPQPKVDAPPAREAIAARVNGQAIPELAVFRSLSRVVPARRDAARKEVLNYLIDNTIIDQYLVQLKIPVEPKEIEDHIQKVKDEAAKDKQDYKKLLETLMITEDELRSELTGALRWDKFVIQQGTEKVLKDMFDRNIDMFNGSRMQARHILIPIKDGKAADAQTAITTIKRNIDGEVAQAVAKVPANSDAITKEKERAKAIERAFADAASKHSTCPSSKDGGDLGYFPRAGAMVEPFARAAFALKPFQMSEPVVTEFGYHLILAVDFKPGKDVKFDQVKPFVQEVYGERLREAVLAAYKPKARIEVLEKK